MRAMMLPVIGGMCADLIRLFSVPVFSSWWWKAKLEREATSPIHLATPSSATDVKAAPAPTHDGCDQ